MSDILLPRKLRHARTSFRYIDSTGVSRSVFTGATVTAARGGDRLGAALEFTKHGGKSTDGKAERALLRSFLASLRGRQNGAYLYDLSYRRRGNFSTGELITNGEFIDGTTGWIGHSGKTTLSAADRILRATYVLNDGSASCAFHNSAALTSLSQYTPYVARAFVAGTVGGITNARLVIGTTAAASDVAASGVVTGSGMASVGFVPRSVSSIYAAVSGIALSGGTPTVAGTMPGDYFTCQYVSMARCAQADNGQNRITHPDAFGSWVISSGLSVLSDFTYGPDQSPTADVLVEDGTSANRSLYEIATVAAAEDDYAFGVYVGSIGRTWVRIELDDVIGSNVSAWVNLTSGTVGTVSTISGTGLVNPRAFCADAGSYRYCVIIARKTSSSTQMRGIIRPATGDNTSTTFTGINGNALSVYHATLANSAVPMRLTGVTSATGTQTGGTIYLKGLPNSTSGLLEIDDQFEIITSRGSELKIASARLESNSVGLGSVRFDPPIRTSPADSAPVVIHQPMGRFLFTGDAVGWDNDPGFWSSSSAEFEEAA